MQKLSGPKKSKGSLSACLYDKRQKKKERSLFVSLCTLLHRLYIYLWSRAKMRILFPP